MISVPIVVYNNSFKWQLDLFWFKQKQLYGIEKAKLNTKAVIIKRNKKEEKQIEKYEWNEIDIPFILVNGVSELYNESLNLLPLNIQLGLEEILKEYNDDEVIELLDGDMFHLEKRNYSGLQHDIILCDTIYEDWHLKSLSNHKNIIDIYFENNGRYYNGGFVPIIATVKTFKKIMYEWKAIHVDICKRDWNNNLKWWAGMYALQAACEKNKVQMVALNNCYIPPINTIENKTIAHYSVDDNLINKRTKIFTTNSVDEYTKTIIDYVTFRNNTSK